MSDPSQAALRAATEYVVGAMRAHTGGEHGLRFGIGVGDVTLCCLRDPTDVFSDVIPTNPNDPAIAGQWYKIVQWLDVGTQHEAAQKLWRWHQERFWAFIREME